MHRTDALIVHALSLTSIRSSEPFFEPALCRYSFNSCNASCIARLRGFETNRRHSFYPAIFTRQISNWMRRCRKLRCLRGTSQCLEFISVALLGSQYIFAIRPQSRGFSPTPSPPEVTSARNLKETERWLLNAIRGDVNARKEYVQFVSAIQCDCKDCNGACCTSQSKNCNAAQSLASA